MLLGQRHIVASVFLSVTAVLVAGTLPALAATTDTYSSPTVTGAETQTIHLGGGSTVVVEFSGPTAVENGPTPDAYQEEKASVTLYGSGVDFAFSGTMYGYWEYDGSNAYRVASAPYCEAAWGTYTECDYNGNGAKIPKFMTWTMEGYTDALDCYSIIIYMYGSGKHTDDTAGPGLCF